MSTSPFSNSKNTVHNIIHGHILHDARVLASKIFNNALKYSAATTLWYLKHMSDMEFLGINKRGISIYSIPSHIT